MGKLSNNLVGNSTSTDVSSKAPNLNGNTSAATIAAMANAMVAAAAANANAAAANAGIVAIQPQNQPHPKLLLCYLRQVAQLVQEWLIPFQENLIPMIQTRLLKKRLAHTVANSCLGMLYPGT